MIFGRSLVGWLLMACVIVFNVNFGTSRECLDRAKWCSKLGTKVPLSRCYKHENRCCRTCRRLRLPISGCPYGDKLGWCNTLGFDRPAADCYAYNETCCQTCHLYDSGIPDCPYGDRVTWCSGVGVRYSVSSCYDHEYHCCQTCNQFMTSINGCPYGDRLAWCAGIGDVFPVEHCRTNSFECCETCQRLLPGLQFGGNDTFDGATRSTSNVTGRALPSTSPSTSTTTGRTLTPFVIPSTSTIISSTTKSTTTTTTTVLPTASTSKGAPQTQTTNRTLTIGAKNHSAVLAIPTPPALDTHVIDTSFGDRVTNHSADRGVVIAENSDKTGQYIESSDVERDDHRNSSTSNKLDHRQVPSNGTTGKRRDSAGHMIADEEKATNSATRSAATSCEIQRTTSVLCATWWIALMCYAINS